MGVSSSEDQDHLGFVRGSPDAAGVVESGGRGAVPRDGNNFLPSERRDVSVGVQGPDIIAELSGVVPAVDNDVRLEEDQSMPVSLLGFRA